jgi:TolB-like protein
MNRRNFFSAARVASTAAALVALGGLSACSSFYYGEKPGAAWFPTNLIEANHRAVDALLDRAPLLLDAQHPIMVATLVNVDRLTESSRLGRIFSEQIAGRMVQRGLRVVELKLRDNVALQRDQGELLLSREVREVSQSHDAQAVVVGTYAASATTLYISLKLVTPTGNAVVAAHDYSLPMEDNVRVLLANGALRY